MDGSGTYPDRCQSEEEAEHVPPRVLFSLTGNNTQVWRTVVKWCYRFLLAKSSKHQLFSVSEESICRYHCIILKIEERSNQSQNPWCWYYQMLTQKILCYFEAQKKFVLCILFNSIKINYYYWKALEKLIYSCQKCQLILVCVLMANCSFSPIKKH